MKTRLNKFLSQAGVVSRREADRLITQGRVRVNGRIVEELGFKIDEGRDSVSVDGRNVKKGKGRIYIILNKPAGYLVTLKDPFQRPTIRKLLPPSLGRVFPVGRLDLESEGLLLLTDDGELAYRLSHPRFEVKKVYVVRVTGEPTRESLAQLEKGIFLEGERTAPSRVRLLAHSPKSSWLRIEIHEGKKREVRRMCRAIGHDVIELKRTAYAGLELRRLKPGGWRFLDAAEVRKLKNAATIC